MTPEFRTYSKQVIANAQVLAESLQHEGFRVVSGGTDTHLLLVDVFAKGVRGKEAETALDEAYITVNKNAIPFDVNPPLNPSGVRLGSPAVTTRGFREGEMRQVASMIAEALNGVQSGVDTTDKLLAVRRRVTELADRFPLYPWKLAHTTA
jgi:glycine hydroxymethyltransferase